VGEKGWKEGREEKGKAIGEGREDRKEKGSKDGKKSRRVLTVARWF
jgi:hypothetical protein